MSTVATLKATAYAYGSINQRDFLDFIRGLEGPKEPDIDEMRKQGIEVEEN